MSAPRWLPVFVLAALLGLAALASEARAQVFRPRSGKGAPVAKAAAPEPTAGARKATPVAAAPAASPAKAKKAPASSRRTGVARKKHRKAREAEASDEDDDDVTVQDDE